MAPIDSSVGRKLRRAGSRTIRLIHGMHGRHDDCQFRFVISTLFKGKQHENQNTGYRCSVSPVSEFRGGPADTTTVNGGTVHFKGEVVNAACAVDAGSIDQTVQLGGFVQPNSLLQAAPALRSVLTSSWMIAILPSQPKLPLHSPVLP